MAFEGGITVKLMVRNKVFLQKYEVIQILHDPSRFPESLVQETLSNENDEYFFIGGTTDMYDFGCVYSEPENVDWLMEQQWIVDYDDYASMPINDLKAFHERLEVKYSDEVDEFNERDDDYRRANYDDENERFTRAAHEIESLRYLINEREGRIKFFFPEGYEVKADTDEEPGLFKRLLNRSAQ